MDFSRFNLLARYRKFRKELRENWAYYQVKADRMAAEKAAEKARRTRKTGGSVTFDEAFDDPSLINQYFEQKRQAERTAHAETADGKTANAKPHDVDEHEWFTSPLYWWNSSNIFNIDDGPEPLISNFGDRI
jgi:hypothetical protein